MRAYPSRGGPIRPEAGLYDLRRAYRSGVEHAVEGLAGRVACLVTYLCVAFVSDPTLSMSLSMYVSLCVPPPIRVFLFLPLFRCISLSLYLARSQ